MSSCSSAPAQTTGSTVATAPSNLASGTGWGFTVGYTPGGNSSCPDSLVCAINSSNTIIGYLTLNSTAVYFCDVNMWSSATCNPSAITTACTASTPATASCMAAAATGTGLSASIPNYWYSVSGSAPYVVTVGSGTTIGSNQIAAVTLPAAAAAVTSFNFSVPGVTYATVAVGASQALSGNTGTCATPGNPSNSQGVRVGNPNDVQVNFTLTQQSGNGVNLTGCPVNATLVFTDSTTTNPILTLSIVNANTLYWWAGTNNTTQNQQTFSAPIPLLSATNTTNITTQPMYVTLSKGVVTVGLGTNALSAPDRLVTFNPAISNISSIAYVIVPAYAANSTAYFISLGNTTTVPPGVENNFAKYWWAYLLGLLAFIVVIVLIVWIIHRASHPRTQSVSVEESGYELPAWGL